jgi:hypothetical protein
MWAILYQQGNQQEKGDIHAMADNPTEAKIQLRNIRSCQECGNFDCSKQGIVFELWIYEPGTDKGEKNDKT